MTLNDDWSVGGVWGQHSVSGVPVGGEVECWRGVRGFRPGADGRVWIAGTPAVHPGRRRRT